MGVHLLPAVTAQLDRGASRMLQEGRLPAQILSESHTGSAFQAFFRPSADLRRLDFGRCSLLLIKTILELSPLWSFVRAYLPT